MPFLNLAPPRSSGKGGGGPEDDARDAINNLRSYGFIAAWFGLALGITLVILYLMLLALKPQGPLEKLYPEGVVKINQISAPAAPDTDNSSRSLVTNLAYIFIFGFAAGTLIAVIYNVLVVKRINLFGLESNLN